MRQIGIREFRQNIVRELADVPFEVTRNGVVVAIVSGPMDGAEITSRKPGNPEGEIKKAVADWRSKIQGITKAEQSDGQRLKS